MIRCSWLKFDMAGVAHALDFFCSQGIDFPPDFIGKKNGRRVGARANRVEFFCVALALRFDVHNKTTDDSNGFATAMFQYFCFLYVDDSLFLLCAPTLAGHTPSVG